MLNFHHQRSVACYTKKDRLISMLRFLSLDIWIGFSFTELASKRKEKTHHRPISLILRRKEQKVGKEKNSENKPVGPSSNSWYL